MNKYTTPEQIAGLKVELLADLATMRECAVAANDIEGLEHVMPAMQRLDTFAILALRLMARTEAAVVLRELQGLQTQATIATDYVALNKALGGGWDGAMDVTTPAVVDVNTGPHFAKLQP